MTSIIQNTIVEKVKKTTKTVIYMISVDRQIISNDFFCIILIVINQILNTV